MVLVLYLEGKKETFKCTISNGKIIFFFPIEKYEYFKSVIVPMGGATKDEIKKANRSYPAKLISEDKDGHVSPEKIRIKFRWVQKNSFECMAVAHISKQNGKKEPYLEIFSDGFGVRFHNRRISALVQDDQVSLIFEKVEENAEEANKQSVQTVIVRDKIRKTMMALSKETMDGLVQGYLSYIQSKNNGTSK